MQLKNVLKEEKKRLPRRATARQSPNFVQRDIANYLGKGRLKLSLIPESVSDLIARILYLRQQLALEAADALPKDNKTSEMLSKRHSRMRSTSLSVISSFVRS